jgi:hypothetical protein
MGTPENKPQDDYEEIIERRAPFLLGIARQRVMENK